MKTRLIPIMVLSLMGIFATASFAQEETSPAADASTGSATVATQEVANDEATENVAKAEKENPRADRAKERFERKAAKKAEIAEHKAIRLALKEERAVARAERKEAKDAEKEERKAEMKAQKDERKAEKKAAKEERKGNKGKGHNK